jgi:hypothetical protein
VAADAKRAGKDVKASAKGAAKDVKSSVGSVFSAFGGGAKSAAKSGGGGGGGGGNAFLEGLKDGAPIGVVAIGVLAYYLITQKPWKKSK